REAGADAVNEAAKEADRKTAEGAAAHRKAVGAGMVREAERKTEGAAEAPARLRATGAETVKEAAKGAARRQREAEEAAARERATGAEEVEEAAHKARRLAEEALRMA
ncbi:unnamed protein product, partial [Amoebophrya sp. A25]